ncbi:MAG: hypothetical protein LBH42_06415, partial [Treponema sp.]|nr:hypothetical protein [Treponema sp.]
RWQAGSSGKPSDKFPLDFSLNASAGILEKKEGPENFSYAETWLDSFGYLVPDPGEEAESRDTKGSFRLKADTTPLGMEFYLQGTTFFSGIRDTSTASTLARFDFPFITGTTRFLFRTEREYRWNVPGNSKDFREDGEIWAGSLENALPLMFSIPIYSLFDPEMNSRMDEFSSPSSEGYFNVSYPDSSQFADRFEFSLQKPISYGLSSLLLPYRFGLRLGRILERRLDTPRDTLTLGATLGFSSINMFGAMGVYPVFGFYMGDELTHTIETTINFPKDEIVSWGFRSENSMVFYGFHDAELTLNNTFTFKSESRIGEGSRWTESLTAAWLVPSQKTLLGTLYASFIRMVKTQSSWLTLANIAESPYELLQKESLEFVFEKIPNISENDHYRFSIIAGHESIVRIVGRLNLTVFAKLRVSEDLSTSNFSFLGTIGATLNLMF